MSLPNGCADCSIHYKRCPDFSDAQGRSAHLTGMKRKANASKYKAMRLARRKQGEARLERASRADIISTLALPLGNSPVWSTIRLSWILE